MGESINQDNEFTFDPKTLDPATLTQEQLGEYFKTLSLRGQLQEQYDQIDLAKRKYVHSLNVAPKLTQHIDELNNQKEVADRQIEQANVALQRIDADSSYFSQKFADEQAPFQQQLNREQAAYDQSVSSAKSARAEKVEALVNEYSAKSSPKRIRSLKWKYLGVGIVILVVLQTIFNMISKFISMQYVYHNASKAVMAQNDFWDNVSTMLDTFEPLIMGVVMIVLLLLWNRKRSALLKNADAGQIRARAEKKVPPFVKIPEPQSLVNARQQLSNLSSKQYSENNQLDSALNKQTQNDLITTASESKARADAEITQLELTLNQNELDYQANLEKSKTDNTYNKMLNAQAGIKAVLNSIEMMANKLAPQYRDNQHLEQLYEIVMYERPADWSKLMDIMREKEQHSDLMAAQRTTHQTLTEMQQEQLKADETQQQYMVDTFEEMQNQTTVMNTQNDLLVEQNQKLDEEQREMAQHHAFERDVAEKEDEDRQRLFREQKRHNRKVEEHEAEQARYLASVAASASAELASVKRSNGDWW